MNDGAPDTERPNVARMYDYLLGGAHNLKVDQEAAQGIIAAWPVVISAARANRGFLRHAVETALDSGIRQFLDLGSGIPTAGNVHELALRRDPEARVVYVEIDHVAVTHSRELLAEEPRVAILRADLTDPEGVLGAPEVTALLDFREPVAVLAVSVLHFIPEDARLAELMAAYRAPLAPGSVLALTTVDSGYPEAVTNRVARTPTPMRRRDPEQLVPLLSGFGADPGDARSLDRWRPEGETEPLHMYGLISHPVEG